MEVGSSLGTGPSLPIPILRGVLAEAAEVGMGPPSQLLTMHPEPLLPSRPPPSLPLSLLLPLLRWARGSCITKWHNCEQLPIIYEWHFIVYKAY